MGKEVEPKIIVPDIEFPIDANEPERAENFLNVFGSVIPVIKFNEYVFGAGEVVDYEFTIRLNKLPSFRLTIADNQFKLRKLLSDDKFDTAVIFLGNKEWYHKFEGIILSVVSDAGDEEITMYGELHVPKLYNNIQKSYHNKTINDVMKDIATSTDIGLFTHVNDKLTTPIPYNLNPNTKYIDNLQFNIDKFTNNLWCIDNFYYLHVGDLSTIRKQKVETYNYKDKRKFDSPAPIIITTTKYADDSNDYVENGDDKKLYARYYTFNSNIGNIHKISNTEYNVNSNKPIDGTTNVRNIHKSNVGIGNKNFNTFHKFIDTTNPDYKEIVNTELTGKSITLEMVDVLYEILPFQQVEVEIFFPRDDNNVNQSLKDEANSGKKTIIGYTMKYVSPNSDTQFPQIQQTIEVI